MTDTFENSVAVGGVRKRDTDNAFERETTITFSDAEPIAYITTSRRADITKYLAHPGFTLTSDQPARNGNPRVVMGLLDNKNFISLRGKSGARKAKSPDAPKRVINAAKCGEMKKDGTVCKMVAKKDTGKCRWHS